MASVSAVGVASIASGANPALPAGARVGDLAVFYCEHQSASPPIPPGWTIFNSGSASPMGSFWGWRYAVAYRRLTDLTPPAWTSTGASGSAPRGAILVYRSAQGPGRVVTYGSQVYATLPLSVGAMAMDKETTNTYPPAQVARPASGYVSGIAGVAGGWGVLVEILPTPAPYPPSPLSPLPGTQVGVGYPVALSWQPQPSDPGRAQTAVEVQVKKGAGAWQFVKADGTLTATETALPGDTTSVLLPASLFASGDSWSWQVRTVESEEWSQWSTVSVFYPVTPPTVKVTAPSTTITDDLTPTVEWVTTPGLGVQDAYRVTIAGPGVAYDTGVLSGAAQTWTVPAALAGATRGGSYRFTVHARQTGGAWADAWVSQVMTWTAPAPPKITATPGAPGAVLDISTGPGFLVDIQRQQDGEWAALDSQRVVGLDGSLRFLDVLAAFGDNSYRVRTYKDLDGVLLPSDWSPVATVPCRDSGSYLARVSDPTDYVRIIVSEEAPRVRERGGAVHKPLNSPYDFVEYGAVRAQSGGFSLTTFRAGEAEALDRLLLSGEPLWYRAGPDVTVDLGEMEWEPKPLVKILVTPDAHTVERIIANRAQPWRSRTVSWVEAP